MRADIYARKSSADGGKSVAQQDDECSDGILEHGWEVGRRFTDDNRSASRYARQGRPDYEALVAHIASGQCEALALWEAARGGRREVNYFQLLELCRERGTKIYIFTHDRLYDLSRRADWRALAQEVIDSADLSAKISEGAQRGKRALARAGRPAGKLLYGYRREYDPATGAYVRQVEHPGQAPIVRRMAKRLIETHSCRRVAIELNEDNVPRLGGDTRWTGRDVHRYLSNPAYVQRRVHRGQRMDGLADWPAILDMDTWTRCQAILRNPARNTREGGSELRWWLVGALTCGREGCGGQFRSHHGGRGNRYQCRECGRVAVKAEDLEKFIGAVVVERMGRPDAVRAFQPREDGSGLAAAEARVRVIEGELAEWRALAVARKVSAASFAEVEAGLLPQLDAARQEARTLAAPALPAELEGVDVAASWDDLSPILKRTVARWLMDITIMPTGGGGKFRPERVEISWKSM